MIFFIYTLFSILPFILVSHAEDVCTQAISIGKLVANVSSHQVYLTHYVGTQKIIHNLATAHTTIPSSAQFNKNLPIVILIHGYVPGNIIHLDGKMAESIKSTNTTNVYNMDYTLFAKTLNYPQAVVNAKKIGQILGKSLSLMKDSGVVGIHLVGHSLGAHLSGFAGKEYKLYKPDLLDRISGIDSAGLCFKNEAPNQRLDFTDAKFVDVMHTDLQLGMLKAIGHADFYPNGGDNMPGIFNNDHLISATYYIESILNNNFLAVNCKDWNTFLTGACKQNPRIPMGYWTPTTARGNFYCKTKASAPFSMGEAGIV